MITILETWTFNRTPKGAPGENKTMLFVPIFDLLEPRIGMSV